VHREAVGRVDVRVGDPLEDLHRDRRLVLGDALLRVVRDRRPLLGSLAGLADLGEHPLELLLVVAQHLLGLLDRDVATADQRLGVELAHRPLLLDEVVHERLRV
jgi:hypothetical protein